VSVKEVVRAESFEVHGTIWLVRRMLGEGIVSAQQTRAAFRVMKADGRRLPWDAAERMIDSQQPREVRASAVWPC